MPLILAIEPDQRQAAQLADLIRGGLNADLVHAQTTEGALTALAGIGDRVPDLVLVPSLLSAQEDAEIAGALRMIAAAANVRMLTIPKFADPNQPSQPSQNRRGVFAKLRGRKVSGTPGGCEPAVFADQIASYLAEAAAERRAREADADLVAPPAATAAPPLQPAIDAQSTAGRPVNASPVVGKSPAPVTEPVVEAPAEPVKMRFKPLVIGPTPPPARSVDAPASVVRDEPVVRVERPLAIFDTPAPPKAAEEPRSIWLDAPDEPSIKTEPATTLREPLFDDAIIREESAEPVENRIGAPPPVPAFEVAPSLVAIDETPPPLATEDAPPAIDVDESSQILAIEEVLQALALEETRDAAVDERPLIFARDEPLRVAAIQEVSEIAAMAETLPAIPTDDAPVVVEIPEAPELLAFEEPAPEPKPAVRRRRRKTRPVSESEDRFDIDALLAPLLSEIAAKRAAPAKSAQLRVPTAVEETPAAAFRAPDVISPPLASAVENPEPVEVARLAVTHEEQLPSVEPPNVQPIAVAQQPAASTVVEPVHFEPVVVLAQAPALPAIEPVAATLIEPSPVEPAAVAAPAEPNAVEIVQVETTHVQPPPAPIAVVSAPAAPMPVVPTTVERQPLAHVPIEQMPVEQIRVERLQVEDIPVAKIPVPKIPVPKIPVPKISVPDIPVPETPVAEIPVIPAAKVAEIAVEQIRVAPMPVAPVQVAHTPVEQPTRRTIAAETEIDPMFFADDVSDAAADPAPHDRPAWVELIESLRKDIERLKAERLPQAEAAPAAQAAEPVEEPQAPRLGRVLSIAAARPANRTEAPAPITKVRTLTPRAKAPKPVQDQWGLFDPDQCGFAALRAKLDEITSREEVSV